MAMNSRCMRAFIAAPVEPDMKRHHHHPRLLVRAWAGRAAPADNAAPREARDWAIAIALHAALALVMWAVVWAAGAPPITEYPPCLVPLLPAPPPVRPPPALPATPAALRAEEAAEQRPATAPEPSEAPSGCDQGALSDALAGEASQLAAAAMATPGADLVAIGPAAGAPGFGSARGVNDRLRKRARNGGSPGSANAVRGALRWFTRHQSANGMEEAEGYQANCGETPKCEPGSIAACGGSAVSVALTGYALLCYLGDGHDQLTPNQYRTTIRKGLDDLCAVQAADGRQGERNDEHAVATGALCEAYAMIGDQALKAPAQRAVNLILARQVQGGAGDAGYGNRLGWDCLEADAARNDASVTGWNVMALTSARDAGLAVGQCRAQRCFGDRLERDGADERA
jgi:hypothetical protein